MVKSVDLRTREGLVAARNMQERVERELAKTVQSWRTDCEDGTKTVREFIALFGPNSFADAEQKKRWSPSRVTGVPSPRCPRRPDL